MKIIISPAKKMKSDAEYLDPVGTPVFMKETYKILEYLKGLSYNEAKTIWACNDKIATENYERLSTINLEKPNIPAILSYDGIAFKYMAPSVFEFKEFDYVQEHLRILSAFYGVLKPLDGVSPYRLEMQAKAKVSGSHNLYEFWGDKIYNEIIDDDHIIINLASKEYSKVIEKYLKEEDKLITCLFGEIEFNEKTRLPKVVQKGVYAKMARGEMVRFMAETKAKGPEDLLKFNRLGYIFSKEYSKENQYVFIRGQHDNGKIGSL